MFSHIFVGITDFNRALRFYEPLFKVLGLEQRFFDINVPWAGWQSAGADRPLFAIAKPFNGTPHEPGNGQMTAFLATTREQVSQAHATALQAGGTCDGTPDLRPTYHPPHHRAHFPDPAGNQLYVG